MITQAIRRFAPALLIAAAVLTTAPSASGEIIDRIVATVGGQIITKSDVAAARALGMINNQGSDDALLQQLIDRVLMLNELRRVAPPDPGSAAVDARVAEIRRRFPSPAALALVLAESGIDESVLRIYAEDDLRLAAYLDERFSAAAQPSEQELSQGANRDVLVAERRRALINAWIAELRRRIDIVVL